MADEAKIKQKIELDGEKEYNRALNDAKRNLRTLRSELKMETAELGRNATEQQKNEVKSKSLKKQIQEQEKVVRACQKALDEVKEKYSDNADAMAAYEQKVNQARTTLANMRNALEDVSDGMDDIGDSAETSLVETRSFAESIESLASAADGVSTAIEGIFNGMIETVKSAITTVWSDMVALAARANSWIDLAGFWNTDAATIQKWANAVGFASGNLEDINSIVTKINSKESKDIAELTGISHENYEDDWNYAMAVMDSLSRMDHRKRNDAAFEIFGRNPGKALDLLNDWNSVLTKLDDFDTNKGGIGMSEDEMATMSALYDKINGIDSMWRAFKDSFEAGLFGEVALDLAGNAEGMLQGLIDYWNANDDDAREKAIDKIEENLTAFFTRLGEAISNAASILDDVGTNLEKSENGTVSALGTLLKGISDVLEWFTDENNIDKVVKGFETLAGIWAGAKMLSAVATLSALAANITTIKNGGGLLGALFARGVGNSGAPTVTGTPPAAQTAGQAGTVLAGGSTHGWMTNLLGIGGVAAIAAGFAAAAKERLSNVNIRGSENAIQQAAGGDEELLHAFETYIGAKNAMDEYAGGLEYDEAKAERMVDTLNAAQEAFFGMAGSWELMDKYSAWQQENGYGTMDGHLPEFMQEQAPEQEPEATEELGEVITEAQRAALEDWWDLMRRVPEDDLDSPVWDEFDTMWPQLEALFAGNETLLTELENRLDTAGWGNSGDDWRTYEDIPASVFDGLGTDMNGASRSLDSASATMRGLPAQILAAVRSGVSNIQVYIDGQTAGRILSPYVSQGIAREIM